MIDCLRGRSRSPAARRRAQVRPFLIGAGAWFALLSAGCSSVEVPRVLPRTRHDPVNAYSSLNHVNYGAIPAHVRRVAVLPLHLGEWRPRETVGLDEALRAELAQMERFEILALSRADLRDRFRVETFASASALPADFLSRLQADFGADAVLFLDLAHYSPYQPVAIGLRAKLVTTDDGEPVWSMDALFDSSRPEVATAARQFSTGQKRPGPAAEDNTGILQSPSRFAKYVGYAVFGTLPPRAIE